MPMYRRREFEARFINEDNQADIAALTGIDNPPLGMYAYRAGGGWIFATPEYFNRQFEEA